MKLTFLGAAHEVTGSCTVITCGGRYFLVDCGMEQGVNVFENEPLPVPAASIEAVFLTHAHIDHSGLLPKLYHDGFRGAIFATAATCSLCDLMLRDSAHIQESDAEWRRRKAERAGEAAPPPLYTMESAMGAIRLLRGCDYGKRYQIDEGVSIRFTDVGHLLGSAAIEVWLTEAGQERKVVFSGDVGNKNKPILSDPQTVDSADYLVIESTYGDRLHDKPGDLLQELTDCLQRTFDRGGTVVVPSFAVGRTQELLYLLREIKRTGRVRGHDGFPVYVDSPLAEEATAVFLQCDTAYLDEETRALMQQGISPIWFDDIRMATSSEESKAINLNPESKVILSASGMCDAGRIRHHLKHTLWRKENTILFAGYQAEGSLGRALLNGAKTVKLFGEQIAVHAEIAALHGASGHADRQGLLDWVTAIPEKPSMVFVNHGDEHACEAFRDLLRAQGYEAAAPYSGAEFDLLRGEMVADPPGRRIEKAARGGRSSARYDALVAAAKELLQLARDSKGRPNKELAKWTDQIRSLIQKWR